MSNNLIVARAKFTARLFARGGFAGLLGLALAIAIMSFLTACQCLNVSVVRPDPVTQPPADRTITAPSSDTKTAPSPSNPPVIPPTSDKKDN